MCRALSPGDAWVLAYAVREARRPRWSRRLNHQPPPPIDRQNLPGHKRRIQHQEFDRTGNILRRADALQRRLRHNALLLGEWREGQVVPGPSGPLRTGDLGSIDADGWLHIKDRRKLVVVRGGANVYPAEVERVLLGLPGVVAAAVFGVPDERLGERVAAVVVLDPKFDPAELGKGCRRVLAGYKVPERWAAVDELPRNAMGKIVRTALLDLLSDHELPS